MPIDIAKLDICNCPDYEGDEGQPISEELEVMANSPGITFVYLSVKIGAISEGCAKVFQKLIMSFPNRFWRFVAPADCGCLHEMTKQDDVSESHSLWQPACNWDNAFGIVVIGSGPVGMEYIKPHC